MILFSVFFTLFGMTQVHAGVNSLLQPHTSIENPASLRDPFVNTGRVQKQSLNSELGSDEVTKTKTVWNQQAKISESVDISSVRVTGVLIGKNRRAILKLQDGEQNFVLKEGETIGPQGPEIKAIMAGGIILVEQINNIYGEPEYIETVIPISN